MGKKWEVVVVVFGNLYLLPQVTFTISLANCVVVNMFVTILNFRVFALASTVGLRMVSASSFSLRRDVDIKP